MEIEFWVGLAMSLIGKKKRKKLFKNLEVIVDRNSILRMNQNPRYIP